MISDRPTNTGTRVLPNASPFLRTEHRFAPCSQRFALMAPHCARPVIPSPAVFAGPSRLQQCQFTSGLDGERRDCSLYGREVSQHPQNRFKSIDCLLCLKTKFCFCHTKAYQLPF